MGFVNDRGGYIHIGLDHAVQVDGALTSFGIDDKRIEVPIGDIPAAEIRFIMMPSGVKNKRSHNQMNEAFFRPEVFQSGAGKSVHSLALLVRAVAFDDPAVSSEKLGYLAAVNHDFTGAGPPLTYFLFRVDPFAFITSGTLPGAAGDVTGMRLSVEDDELQGAPRLILGFSDATTDHNDDLNWDYVFDGLDNGAGNLFGDVGAWGLALEVGGVSNYLPGDVVSIDEFKIDMRGPSDIV